MTCDRNEGDSCEVRLVGSSLSITGPTPLDAPYLSSELATKLLDSIDDTEEAPTIRFIYRAEYFTFSWELHAPLIARLAELGARVEFCLNGEEPVPAGLGIELTMTELRVWTGRDPDELTARLGVEPTKVGRIGEPIRANRVYETNFWRAHREVEGFPPLDEVWREFLQPFPADTAAICGSDRACLGAVLQAGYSGGGFALEAPTIARLAEVGLPFGVWLYPA